MKKYKRIYTKTHPRRQGECRGVCCAFEGAYDRVTTTPLFYEITDKLYIIISATNALKNNFENATPSQYVDILKATK